MLRTTLSILTLTSILFGGIAEAQRVPEFQAKISDTDGNFDGDLANEDRLGAAIACLGDLNGDGILDLAVGERDNADPMVARGAVWIWFMSRDGTVKEQKKISDLVGGFTSELDNSDRFGFSIANIGDLDDDGHNDLAVGAPLDDDGGENRGAVYILFLNASGYVSEEQKISDTEGDFDGELDNYDSFGYSVTRLADGELVVGAPRDDDGSSNAGALWVLDLNTDGTVAGYHKISATEGDFDGELEQGGWFGSSVTCIGDVDDDGWDDLAVGARGVEEETGAVWILFLDQFETVDEEQLISSEEGEFDGELDSDDRFGQKLASPGDLNLDGVPDLLVAAPRDDDGGDDRGAVWVLFLNDDGTVDETDKISSDAGAFEGRLEDGDNFGSGIAVVDDPEVVGLTVAFGAEGDNDGGPDRGAVYLVGFSFEFARGDINGNGEVKAMLDAIYLMSYWFQDGPEPVCFDAADTDDSGRVSPLVDAYYLLAWGYIGGPPPPDPGPMGCGPDPTADEVTCDEPTCE